MAINEKFYIEANEPDYNDDFYECEQTEVHLDTIAGLVWIHQEFNDIKMSVTQARKLREILERIN